MTYPIPHCPRPGCGGFVVHEFGDIRCVSCGWRDNPPYPEKIRDAYDKIKCRNCQQTPVKGKTYCQHHLDYMIDYHRKTRAVG